MQHQQQTPLPPSQQQQNKLGSIMHDVESKEKADELSIEYINASKSVANLV